MNNDIYYREAILNEGFFDRFKKKKKEPKKMTEFIRKMSSGDGDEDCLYIDFYK